MMVVPKPGEFWMGEGDERHRRRIDRSFAIASKEVTVEQFLRFRQGPSNTTRMYCSHRRLPGEQCVVVRCGGVLQLAE